MLGLALNKISYPGGYVSTTLTQQDNFILKYNFGSCPFCEIILFRNLSSEILKKNWNCNPIFGGHKYNTIVVWCDWINLKSLLTYEFEGLWCKASIWGPLQTTLVRNCKTCSVLFTPCCWLPVSFWSGPLNFLGRARWQICISIWCVRLWSQRILAHEARRCRIFLNRSFPIWLQKWKVLYES